MHIINDDIQRKKATYLPAQSPAHKINDKNTTLTICSRSQLLIKSMLKYLKKNIKESPCFSSNLHTKSIIKYASYKNLRNLPRKLLSCKISYKNALKPSITSSAAASHVRSLKSNVRKASKISYPLYPLHSYL